MAKIHHTVRNYFHYPYSDGVGRRFAAWFAAPGGREEKDAALRHEWEGLSTAATPATEQSFEQVQRHITANRQRRRVQFFQRFGRIAALFVLPIMLAAAVYFYVQNNRWATAPDEWVECFVPHGEIRTVVLPDSSQALLNAGSVLIYPRQFNDRTRGVYLNGEACFTVVREAHKPFVVKTADMDVEVLGTVFDVLCYADSDHATTTLKSGKVSIRLKNLSDERVVLEPNEQAVYNRKLGSVQVKRVNVEHALAWQNGYLVIQGMSMGDIAKTIERRYGVTIYLNAAKYEEEKITAKFIHGETLDEFLAVLQQVVPGMKYKVEGAKIYIY